MLKTIMSITFKIPNVYILFITEKVIIGEFLFPSNLIEIQSIAWWQAVQFPKSFCVNESMLEQLIEGYICR